MNRFILHPSSFILPSAGDRSHERRRQATRGVAVPPAAAGVARRPADQRGMPVRTIPATPGGYRGGVRADLQRNPLATASGGITVLGGLSAPLPAMGCPPGITL